ncbi:Ig-like domain-containing protein [Paenibacillus pectinilyticus]|uniref:Ig-like domain-containing protein n=1 Tax=Paenibacillus pectinilyticus TaxID=512399 RepID=UPI000A7A2162|nr:Ig-like domain-containing protein [Paenibacillus pectinilyticus]
MIKRGLSIVLIFTILCSLFTFGAGVSFASGPTQPVVTTTTNSVSLTWTAVQGADSYNVYRSLSSNGTLTKVNSTSILAVSYTDTGLTANTRYYYKVASVSGGVESGLSTEVSGLTEPDFGPNVFVFDPSTPAADIQSKSTDLFTQQESNQFGTQRYAMLFKPGAYTANIKVGFYTQVSGLGQVPDDVTINGGVTVDANWMTNHNATQNFWRSVENLAVAPTSGDMKFAVSQAAPIRRLHVKGNLTLHDQGGWASGGFLADTLVDGTVNSGSQQQWFTRNSQWGTWNGSLWNTTIVGSVNAPAEDWPTKAFTVVDKAPVIREKPFLTFDSVANQYKVFVPDTTTNKSGTSWSTGSTPGTSIPIENFLIADTTTPVATINAALDQGKNLLFTPGVYHFTDTVKITKPNTVVLGLGLATLHSDNGIMALSVADVDGVKIAGLLFEAGSVNSPVLLQVGPKGSSNDHSANPTSLHDLYFRVGGDALAKADVCIEINSNNVIGDHFWVWRADHGTGAGWNSNTTINGMIVNGNDVTMYGLFVEHFHEYQTLWNGERGRTYFYQTEIPYDVPNQESWMSNSGTVNGYASYKVADTVASHEAYGLGIYSNFTGGIVSMESGIEIPDAPGVKIHNATTVSLNKVGEISHVANAMGSAVNTGTMRTTIGNYVPRTAASLTDVSAATIAGKAPVLPAVVTQVFTDATTKKVAVAWDTMDPSKYATVGSFVVNGTVFGTSVKAVANVTVAAAPNVPVTKIQISGANNVQTITVNSTLQMTSVVTPVNADNGSITWSVVGTNGTATNLATMSSTGLLTAVKEGTVKVIATANDGTGVTASQFITISSIKVGSITVSGLNSVTAVTYKGASLQMVADVQPLNATDRTFTWSVANGTGTATIDASGVLKALSDGSVTVKATAKDGSGITGVQTITISGQLMVVGNGWSWVRESRDNWAIDGMNPNVMKLTTIEGSWGGTKPSNLLLRDLGTTGDFSITTKLNFDASNNFEWAGLVVYQDDGNLISLGRQANGNPAVKQIRFSQVKAGSQTDKSYTDPVASGDVYLKIDKSVNTYKGYYSSDGITWTQVTDTFTFTLTTPKIGIFDRKLGGNAAKTAGFSDFKLGGTVIPYWISVNSVSVSGNAGATGISSVNGTLQMLAQVLPANATSNSVLWTVYNADGSPTDKAAISSSGLLTAAKNGQVKVVAMAYDGSGISGSALFDITGQPVAVASLNVTGANGTSAITTKGNTLQMAAAVLPANATNQTVTWSVYNLDGTTTDKATISASGLLTSIKNGQVKVVASANDGSGVSGTAIITISGQVLTPPTISSVSSGDAQATLVWGPMDESLSYSVYQRTAEGTFGDAVATVGGDVYSYTATDLVNGTTYYFVIKATYPGGISEASNQMMATPQMPAPGAPVLQAAATDDGHVQLTWNSVEGSTGYQLFMGTASGAYDLSPVTVDSSVYNYDVTGLANGTTYYFVLKALNPGGISGASNEVSGTPQVPAPGAPVLQAAATGDGHVQLTWNSVDGSTGYQLFMGTASETYNLPPVTVDSSVYNYDVTGLANGTTYYFVVKALNPGGISGASNEVSGTPLAPVVIIAVTGITLDQSSLNLIVGNSGQLTATVLPADAANQMVTWNSSNANIARVDADGKVTGVSFGRAEITATTVDGGFTATTTVNVATQNGDLPVVPAAPNHVITITPSELTNSQNGITTVEVPAQTSEIRLPANMKELIKQNKLEIKSDALTLSFPTEVLNQLTDKFTADELKSGTISLKLDLIANTDAKSLINNSHLSSVTENKLIGDVYEFHLVMQTSDGKTIEISKFDKPITIELKVPTSINPKLAGIFYIANDGTLTYIGGKLNDDVISAELNHFSKYAVLEVTKSFADVPSSHWASDVIKELAAKQIVEGTSVTSFEPERNVSRAEFTALLVRALKLTDKAETAFTDVKSSDWYADAVSAAVKAGIVQGKLATLFDPNAPITREEMVTLLLRAYEFKYGKAANQASRTFADEDQVSAWAKDYVQAAAALHFIEGRAADKFEPKGISTRAEAAQILYNLLVATKAL